MKPRKTPSKLHWADLQIKRPPFQSLKIKIILDKIKIYHIFAQSSSLSGRFGLDANYTNVVGDFEVFDEGKARYKNLAFFNTKKVHYKNTRK